MLCRVPRMPIKRNFSEEEKEEKMEVEEDQTRETSAAAIATVAAAATLPTAAATATAIVATSGTASSSGKSLLKSNIPVVSTLFYKSKMILPMGWTSNQSGQLTRDIISQQVGSYKSIEDTRVLVYYEPVFSGTRDSGRLKRLSFSRLTSEVERGQNQGRLGVVTRLGEPDIRVVST
ncbi:hypothetical protein V1477_000471 [Vespula maculifrons]|uniref:Uncharacterized protein n=1 Tax=Vespula maculifrons TaxID=7453 RepID=A0ABD2D1P8_VESMC